MLLNISKHHAVYSLLLLAFLGLVSCDNDSTGDHSQTNNNSSANTPTTPPPIIAKYYYAINSNNQLVKFKEGFSTSRSVVYSGSVYNFVIKGDFIYIETVPSGFTDSYIVKLDLKTNAVNNFNWTLKGQNPDVSINKIYFDDNAGKIKRCGLNGESVEEIVITKYFNGTLFYPRVSSDNYLYVIESVPGYKWYYEDQNSIIKHNLTTGVSSLVNNQRYEYSSISISPDGTLIAATRVTGITPPLGNIYVINAKTGIEKLFLDSNNPLYGSCRYPVWIDNNSFILSSDNKKVPSYYSSWDGQHYYEALYVYDLSKNSLSMLSNSNIYMYFGFIREE